MKLSVTSAPLDAVPAQVVVACVYETPEGPLLGPDADGLGLGDLLARTRFTGREGETVLVAGGRHDVVLVAGLGPHRRAGLAAVRRAAAQAVRSLGRFDQVAFVLPAPLPLRAEVAASTAAAGPAEAELAAAIAEGALDGLYRRRTAKSGPAEPWNIGAVTIAVSPGAEEAARAAVAEAEIVSSCVTWARGLIDTPAGDLTPAALAEAASAMGAEAGLTVRVRHAAELRAEGFGGILAVGGGSDNPPCFIEATYGGTNGTVVGLAGKGITFDSGGLFLKSGAQMADMMSDMAGAATMLATARAAALLGLPVGVLAVAPCAENMPSGHSYRPGDVIRHYGGGTSEVADTDAEGRVVLADALAYLAARRPAAIVDAATLTYDVIKALGDQIGGILGTDDALVGELIAAGRAAGEPWWQLPLWQGYRPNIDSPVADVRNDGGKYADAIHAALFLAEFAGDVPWAHLDIAGTAFRERDTPHAPAGATGTAIRTLVHWLRSR